MQEKGIRSFVKINMYIVTRNVVSELTEWNDWVLSKHW